jgi:hypothetical protein
MIAAIAGFLARPQTAWPMAGGGAECTVGGRTPAAIVVQAPTVSIGLLEGSGTTLTVKMGGITTIRSGAPGMPATRDWRPDRATLVVENGNVTAIACG